MFLRGLMNETFYHRLTTTAIPPSFSSFPLQMSTIAYFNKSITCPRLFSSSPSIPYLFSSTSSSSEYYWSINTNGWKYEPFVSSSAASVNLLDDSLYEHSLGSKYTNSLSRTWNDINNALLPEASSCAWPTIIAKNCWFTETNTNFQFTTTASSPSTVLTCQQQQYPKSSIIHLFYEQLMKANDYILKPIPRSDSLWLCPADSVVLLFLPFHQFYRYKLKVLEWFQYTFIDGLRGIIANPNRGMYHNGMSLNLVNEFLQLEILQYQRYEEYIIINETSETLCILPPYSKNNHDNECYPLADISFGMVTNASYIASLNGTFPLSLNEFVNNTLIWNKIFRIMHDYELKNMDTNILNQINLRNESLGWIISLGTFSCLSVGTLLWILFILIQSIRSEAIAEQRALQMENKTKMEHTITSYLCHELRNPLHGIISSLELLAESEKEYKKTLKQWKNYELQSVNYRTNVPTNSLTTDQSTTTVPSVTDDNPVATLPSGVPNANVVTSSTLVKTVSDATNTLPQESISSSVPPPIDLSLITERKEILSSINTCVGQMLAIANDMLDLTKLTEGKLQIRYSRSSLNSLLRKIRISYHNWSKVPLYISPIRTNTPTSLPLPTERLIQVLSNGLSNSIKHTKNGFIFIIAQWIPARNYVDVNDTAMSPFSKDFAKLSKKIDMGDLYVLEEGHIWYTKSYNRKLAEQWLLTDTYLPSLAKDHDDKLRHRIPQSSVPSISADRTSVRDNTDSTASTSTSRYTGSSSSFPSDGSNEFNTFPTEASIMLEVEDFAPAIIGDRMMKGGNKSTGSTRGTRNGPTASTDADNRKDAVISMNPIPEDSEEDSVPPSLERRERKNSITTPPNVANCIYDGAVLFSIIDTGTGLDPTIDPESLFDAFTSFSGGPGSTGLGLGLSRHLSRTMNGDAWLENPTEKDYAYCARYLESMESKKDLHPSAMEWLENYHNRSLIRPQNGSSSSKNDSSIRSVSNVGSSNVRKTNPPLSTPKAFTMDNSSAVSNSLGGAVFRVILPVCNYGTRAYHYLEGLESRIRTTNAMNSSIISLSSAHTGNDSEDSVQNISTAKMVNNSDSTTELRESFRNKSFTKYHGSANTKNTVSSTTTVMDKSPIASPTVSSPHDTPDSTEITISLNPLLSNSLKDEKDEFPSSPFESSSTVVTSTTHSSVSTKNSLSSSSTNMASVSSAPSPSRIRNIHPQSDGSTGNGSSSTPLIKVLWVEDDEVNRRIGMRHLMKLGYRVETMNDGVGVLERIIQAEKDNDPFAIILTDLVMEHMSGGALVQYIRESGRSTENLPVIAVTGNAGLEYEIDSLRTLGFNDVLWKPFSQAALKTLLEKYCVIKPNVAVSTTSSVNIGTTISSNPAETDSESLGLQETIPPTLRYNMDG